MRKRSKRYKQIAKLFQTGKTYTLAEAMPILKKAGNIKFDSFVDMHFHLNVDSKQADQMVDHVPGLRRNELSDILQK